MTAPTPTIDTLRLTGPHQALNHAIRALAEKDLTTPCAGSDLPTHNHAEKRAQAVATMCGTCPVCQECAAAGQTEAWHVWGGMDRTNRPVTPTGATIADLQPNKGWTAAEDDTLRACATTKQAARALPHRTPRALQWRAREIGHRFNGSYTPWTTAEDATIRAAATLKAATSALPKRSRAAVQKRAQTIGHRFTPRQDAA